MACYSQTFRAASSHPRLGVLHVGSDPMREGILHSERSKCLSLQAVAPLCRQSPGSPVLADVTFSTPRDAGVASVMALFSLRSSHQECVSSPVIFSPVSHTTSLGRCLRLPFLRKRSSRREPNPALMLTCGPVEWQPRAKESNLHGNSRKTLTKTCYCPPRPSFTLSGASILRGLIPTATYRWVFVRITQ